MLISETMPEVIGLEAMGTVSVLIMDPFSYEVDATAVHPNILRIFGMHTTPSGEDVPAGCTIVDEAPEGPWSRDLILRGSINTAVRPIKYLVGELYAVQADIMPQSSGSEPGPKKQRKGFISNFFMPVANPVLSP